MKKVLLAFDGEHFSEGVFEFVRQMHLHQPVFAIGMFLPSVDYGELLYSFGGVISGPLYISEAVPADEAVLDKNIAHFKKLCEESGIGYKIHRDFNRHVVTQVKEETRFADMLVVSGESFYENLGVETQDEYIANVLHKTECPVVLVPEKYVQPESVILAYDGSEQSVYAMKQFTYLLPEFNSVKALLASFGDSGKEIPDRQNIEELLLRHFEHLTILKVRLAAKKDIEQWIVGNGNTMLVAGAYGRSLFSETFRNSFITAGIKDHKVPIFVAHR